MVDPSLEHRVVGLSGRELTIALLVKYTGLVVYGVWAGIVEVPTMVAVGSSAFAFAWAMTVTGAALLAGAGTLRTWLTGRYRFEKWATAVLILSFMGYSYALIYRALFDGVAGAAPLALLPVILCALPAIEFFKLVRSAKSGGGE